LRFIEIDGSLILHAANARRRDVDDIALQQESRAVQSFLARDFFCAALQRSATAKRSVRAEALLAEAVRDVRRCREYTRR
jgi:hypothetical protein